MTNGSRARRDGFKFQLGHNNPSVGSPHISVSDPIGSGFVTDLARPTGNVTGFANFQPTMGGKWLIEAYQRDVRFTPKYGNPSLRL
jgi:hypothetical protein